jgi:class 3 adenylate cyclase/tetratricopeptide (TPR) repeat protein
MDTSATPGPSSSRLMVFMFTDLVGSTALKDSLRSEGYLPLLKRHDELLRDAIADVPGAKVQQDTGDGIFAVFATASDAVRAALRFQWMMRNEAWPADAKLESRIGIHLGEVAESTVRQDGGNKLVGLSVDLAARVMSLAVGGQILMTREAFNSARQFVDNLGENMPPVRWSAHGPYLFKGNEEPMELFEVALEGQSPMTPPPNSDKAKRYMRPGEEETLGWRPAIGQALPNAPQWIVSEKLGEGGFGEVWLAIHAKAKSRRVFKFCFDADRLRALKREVALFRLLKEALGDRRDIAAVRDWKFDESPYFIELEYSPAGNLAKWLDTCGGVQAVPLEKRLAIIAGIAKALAAAHSVAVLHKDIKPSNVLMVQDETEEWYPRLTDFGIGTLTDRSKLADHNITAAGFTASGLTLSESYRTGTQMYAPPESQLGKPHTAQGDIYALGVMLYQMTIADLTRPLASGWERDVSDDLLREDIAACVDVDASRRFASAAELAQRLESIPARRTQRAAEIQAARSAQRRRGRRRLMGFTLIAASLLLFLGVCAALYHIHNLNVERSRTKVALEQAVIERDNSRAILKFLTDDVLEGARPERIGDFKISAAIIRVTIQPAANAVGKQFADNPLVEASIRHVLAVVYQDFERSDLAQAQAEAALALRRKVLGNDHVDTLRSMNLYAQVLNSLGRGKEAEPLSKYAVDHWPKDGKSLYEEGLERSTKVLGADHPYTIKALSEYALALATAGRYKEAEPLYKTALERRTRTLGPNHPATLALLNGYTTVLTALGRSSEAEALLSQPLKQGRRSLNDPKVEVATHRALAEFSLQLGNSRYAAGDHAGAQEAFVTYQELFRQLDATDPAWARPPKPTAMTRPTSSTIGFWYINTDEIPRGLRIWRKIDENTWDRSWPNGRHERFRVVAKDDPTLGKGLIARGSPEDKQEFWLPQLVENASIEYRAAASKDAWHAIAPIRLGVPDLTFPLPLAATRPAM